MLLVRHLYRCVPVPFRITRRSSSRRGCWVSRFEGFVASVASWLPQITHKSIFLVELLILSVKTFFFLEVGSSHLLIGPFLFRPFLTPFARLWVRCCRVKWNREDPVIPQKGFQNNPSVVSPQTELTDPVSGLTTGALASRTRGSDSSWLDERSHSWRIL